MLYFAARRTGKAIVVVIGAVLTRRLAACAVQAALVVLAYPAWGQVADPARAVQTVEAFHATAVLAMQEAESLGYAGRRGMFAAAVDERFDIAFIARTVMGRHWAGLRPDQREALVKVLERLTASRYASEFDGYSGERFQFLEARPLKRGRMLVRTEIVRSGKEDISLDYVLHEGDGRWRIVNVVAEGVSDLALKRAEYGSIIDDKGFDYLLEKLTEQAARYEGETPS